MSSESNDWSLILRYFDGELSAEELEALNQRLMNDPEFRQEFRNVAEQAVSLGDLARSQQFEDVSDKQAGASTPATLLRQFPLAATALMLASLVGAIFWMMQSPGSAAISSVDLVDGAVTWADAEGQRSTELRTGDSLGPGTLYVESSTGMAQIRYADSTTVTFSGESEVQISAPDGWKRLVLRRGHLTADVAPQPAGKPLTLITDTAEVEVLGTVLSMGADKAETDLVVDSGKVSLRRLADGKKVEVTAGSRVVASLDTTTPLELTPDDAPATAWSLGLPDTKGNRVTKGIVQSRQNEVVLQAEPYVAGKGSDGTKIVREGIAINGPQGFGSAFVDLTPETRILLRFRSENSLTLFLCTRDPGGRFGGNYEYQMDDASFPPSMDGWRELEIALSSFELVEGLRSRTWKHGLDECEVTKIIISVIEGGELEVQAVAAVR